MIAQREHVVHMRVTVLNAMGTHAAFEDTLHPSSRSSSQDKHKVDYNQQSCTTRASANSSTQLTLYYCCPEGSIGPTRTKNSSLRARCTSAVA